MVFQSYALYPHMTVYDNMAFGMKLAKAGKGDIDKRVRASAEILQITPYLDRLPKQLSGGQRQRVAIARALLADASLLLLDDALSAVDTQTETSILQHLLALRKSSRNKTTLIVSHRLSAVMDAEHILVLKDGCIVEQGDHASLIAQGNWYASQWRYQQLQASLDAD
jgi:ABC-type sugar transport system ATPase subunit